MDNTNTVPPIVDGTGDLRGGEDNEEIIGSPTSKVEDNEEFTGAVERALSYGKKEWKRSKIMIVGEGRAGKTSLTNSIIGRDYVDTESTVGINQLTCDIKYTKTGGGKEWNQYEKPEKELEAALASVVAAQKAGKNLESSASDNELMSLMKQQKLIGSDADEAVDTVQPKLSSSGGGSVLKTDQRTNPTRSIPNKAN